MGLGFIESARSRAAEDNMDRAGTRVFVMLVALLSASLSAQSTVAPGPAGASSAAAFVSPRTPWGDPDLQGLWPSGSLNGVPFERPKEFGLRAELTAAEYAQRVANERQQAQADAVEFVTPGPAITTPLGPSHWLESGRASRQASLVVDPPDGRLPPMTEDGARRARAWPSTNPTVGYARAQDFNVYDRCITRGVLGSAFPNIYNSGMEIMQAPGLVAIRYEMVHETRIIPLDGRPHLSPAIRSYMGDARGRWEGATLVVETTHFNGLTGSLGRNGNGNPTSTALRLVERFTRRDADTLDYSVVVDDPQTWTRPWTVAFSPAREPGYTMFEYACHEGNYSIANMLRGFRAEEAGR
jgi:hypothetical protein